MRGHSALSGFGQRVKAGLVLADKTAAEVAPALNISARTLERVMQGKREPREWEIQQLALQLAIPEWFLRDGFSGNGLSEVPDRDELLRRLAESQERLAEDMAELRRLVASGRSRVPRARTQGR